MKNIFGLLLLSLLLAACSPEDTAQPQSQKLYIFATENKVSENFWQDNLAEFSEIFDCEISWQIFSDPYQMYAEYSNLDSLQQQPDLILGLDEIVAAKAITDSVFAEVKLNNLHLMNKRMRSKQDKLIPLFYSSLGFLYNKSNIENHPHTFGEIQDGIWQQQVLMAHPLTSALGNSFLIWSIAAFGPNGYGHFWRSMKDNIYQAPADWDLAADMFLADQAPILYAPTSYYDYFADLAEPDKYGLFVPAEGTFLYTEFGGVLQQSSQPKLATDLLNYLISDNFQSKASCSRHLLPINKNIEHDLLLPENKRIFRLQYSASQIDRNNQRWGERWERLTK